MATGFFKRRLGFRTRRYGGAKRTLRKARAGRGRIASKMYVKQAISRMMENKYILSNLTTVSSNIHSTNPVMFLLNPLVQGDNDDNRTGSKVHFKSLNIRMELIPLSSYPPETHPYRILLFRYKQPRGADPTFTNLFNTATPTQFSQYNKLDINFSSRFEIIRDMTIQPVHQYSAQLHTIYKKINIRQQVNHITDYSLGNTGTIADIDTNAYFLAVISPYADNIPDTRLNLGYTMGFKDM